MEQKTQGQIRNIGYICGYCGGPGTEPRRMGVGGRKGAWRTYHPACSRKAKRANDRYLANRRYRHLKSL